MEVILEVKAKKACVFNGFRRQTTKSTVSRQLVEHLSSARDNLLFKPYQNGSKTPENQGFPGFSYTQKG